jgi:hypothetical protein
VRGRSPIVSTACHIEQDYWQSWKPIGYNEGYNWVFKAATGVTGTSMYENDFTFCANGTEYLIWVWKGDYINLGAGAEAGLYKDPILGAHWQTAPEDALPMALRLVDNRGTVIFDYAPDEKQWWITGFDPNRPNMQADDLIATVTIDFGSRPDLWAGFYGKQRGEESNPWIFDPSKMTATLTY